MQSREKQSCERVHRLRIGHTPVIEDPELSEVFGIRHLFIKDESANEYGTHKDRKSLAIVTKAINSPANLRPEALCILTAGNAGLSLATVATLCGLPVTAFINPNSISAALQARLQEACEMVIPIDTENRLWESNELKNLAGARQGRRVTDATNGVNAPYEAIVDEIWRLSPEVWPDVILLPIGSGELFLGVAHRLRRNHLRTRLIGITAAKDSAADKLYARWNPQADHINAVTRAAPYHQVHCLDDEALLMNTYSWLKETKSMACEPSSAAAFAALHRLKSLLRSEEKVLVINTGTFNSYPTEDSNLKNSPAATHK